MKHHSALLSVFTPDLRPKRYEKMMSNTIVTWRRLHFLKVILCIPLSLSSFCSTCLKTHGGNFSTGNYPKDIIFMLDYFCIMRMAHRKQRNIGTHESQIVTQFSNFMKHQVIILVFSHRYISLRSIVNFSCFFSRYIGVTFCAEC